MGKHDGIVCLCIGAIGALCGGRLRKRHGQAELRAAVGGDMLATDGAALPPRLLLTRRSVFGAALALTPLVAAADGASLEFKTTSSGLQFADAKVGSGQAFVAGDRVAIDYVMSTTGARYGTKIDSTKDRNAPYSWVLGDGSTILGLEEAILGAKGIPPMLPGGVRRLIVPAELAYADLARPRKNSLQIQDCSTGRGPIPPQEVQSSGDMGAGEFQRFKNIYCNANRPYQPDLVLDVKLFGKRN
jgi:hypothetical protein